VQKLISLCEGTQGRLAAQWMKMKKLAPIHVKACMEYVKMDENSRGIMAFMDVA